MQLLQENNHQPEIVEYLKNPLSKEQLNDLTLMLNCSVRDIIRTSEADYRENNLANENLSDDELLNAIVKMPKLMQRPIVVNEKKAAVGRPPESILDIF